MPARGDRLQAIFLHAVTLPPHERLAYVASACEGDLELAREAASLLAADDGCATADALPPPPALPPPVEDDGPEDKSGAIATGQRIGPYRLVRVLGRGGMGTVYLAERDDVQKAVALKRLRTGFHSSEGTRRFLLERKLLARLDHPNIARFLDAGLDANGLPYFVMEYVDGAPLLEHARALPIEERLRLFDGVCAAVAYAHQRLVVHRDLKPSNIHVDGSGVVKLLDFGIAKMVAEPADDVTSPGVRPMTPEYAAPEQLRGEPITPATDVYGLGLLLYELLTGTRPYAIRQLTPGQAERIVCELAVPRPSTRLAGRIPKREAGDLDAICLRALEKDPDRRYPTAAELRADVQRYRSRRPVEARVPTRLYVARTFVARHRTPAAFVALLVALLIGGSATVAWQAQRAERERGRAEQALRESESVTGFLIELFEAQSPNSAQGQEPSARELIARGVERAERLTTHPIVQARMFDTIGRVYQAMGDLQAAEDLLRRALAVRRSQLGLKHADTATSLHNLANLLFERGVLVPAGRLFAEALEVRREVLHPRHPDLAATLGWYGEFLARVRKDPDSAAPLVREALAIGRQVLDDDDPRLASLLTNMAAVTTARGDHAATERLLREALAIQSRQLGRAHPDAIVTLNNIGTTLIARGDLNGGEIALRQALELTRRVLGPSHHNVAIGLNNLAALLRRRGRFVEAADTQRQAVLMASATLGASHPTVVRMSNRLAQLESQRDAAR